MGLKQDLESAKREEVLRAISSHGVTGVIHIARPTSGDELVIVLMPDQVLQLKEKDDLPLTLMSLLHIKIWIVPYAEVYEPLLMAL